MTSPSRVLVAMRVRAPAMRAFTAFTDRIGEWWQPNGLFQFTPGRAGTMVFETGPAGRLLEKYSDGSSFVVGYVRDWDPPHRFVLGWRHTGFAPGQETELHVRFDEVTGPSADVQTRITVEHFGWDRIPRAHASRHGFPIDVFELRFAEWWQEQLRAIGAIASRPGGRAPLE